MGRNENEDVSSLDLPDPITHEISERTESNVACARISLNPTTKMVSYYVLCSGGQVFDPNNTDTRYRSRNRGKMKRVKKTMFDLYIKFLDTKHKTYLYQAEREI